MGPYIKDAISLLDERSLLIESVTAVWFVLIHYQLLEKDTYYGLRSVKPLWFLFNTVIFLNVKKQVCFEKFSMRTSYSCRVCSSIEYDIGKCRIAAPKHEVLVVHSTIKVSIGCKYVVMCRRYVQYLDNQCMIAVKKICSKNAFFLLGLTLSPFFYAI